MYKKVFNALKHKNKSTFCFLNKILYSDAVQFYLKSNLIWSDKYFQSL